MTREPLSTADISQAIEDKLNRCREDLRRMRDVVVAFSAGVDSTFVLALAVDTLGAEHVVAAIGRSPSLPARELEQAVSLARRIGVELVEIDTDEMDDERYAANPAERCYFCKKALFTRLASLAERRGFRTIVSGANRDDAGDYRPGLRAGAELGVRNPLMDAGLTKSDIRLLSQRMNLPTWNKPAMPCLASRVPYGEPITPERLARIERAEECLRRLGLSRFRVRDHGDVARIEAMPEEFAILLERRLRVVSELRECGYAFVAMDLSGYRTGALNEVLQWRQEADP